MTAALPAPPAPVAALASPRYCDNVYCADALTFLRGMPDASVDAVITDPPYAEVDRDYGRLSEVDWMYLMQGCVREFRRILKPTGSAMLVLQPNSACVGRMRSWLWDFMSWAAREWNIVQDAYWWNIAQPPTVHTHATNGLMRPSVKHLVWLGNPDCYRNQSAVLWTVSDAVYQEKIENRALHRGPSGYTTRRGRLAETALTRGGSTPFNLIPLQNTNSWTSAAVHGHGAGTPEDLVRWWMRYLTRPGDLVCDPFMGSGTTALVAQAMQRHYTGCERLTEYVIIAYERLSQPRTEPLPLFADAPAPSVAAAVQMEMGL